MDQKPGGVFGRSGQAITGCRAWPGETVAGSVHAGGASNELAGRLAMRVDPAGVACTCKEVFERFNADPVLQAVPVVHDGKPPGVNSRFAIIDRFARPFRRELFGKKSCIAVMNPAPVLVEADSTVQEIGWRVSALEAYHDLGEGIIIVDKGVYLGMCSGEGTFGTPVASCPLCEPSHPTSGQCTDRPAYRTTAGRRYRVLHLPRGPGLLQAVQRYIRLSQGR